MRRVLLVLPSGKPGGSELRLLGLARSLPNHGWRPAAAVLGPGPIAELLESVGCDVIRLDAGRTRNLARTGATIRALRGAIKRTAAEAVISSLSRGHVYGGIAAATMRVPAVWWQRTVPAGGRADRVAALVPSAAVVCVSRAAADAQHRLTPRSRIEVISPGVPLADLASRRGTGGSVWPREVGDGPLVGVVARLHPSKGQDVFLRAAATVRKTHPATRFVIVGGAILGHEGTYEDDLRRLAGSLGLNGSVRFVGHQGEPWPWLDALDVLVLPTRDEAFGAVLVEAMALGTPVVATSVGGIPEFVTDEVSGLLVEPDDADALASSVVRMLDDDALRRRLAAGGEAVALGFDERRMADRFASLLAEVTG